MVPKVASRRSELDPTDNRYHQGGMGFFRSPFLYVPIAVLLLAVIVLREAGSALDAV